MHKSFFSEMAERWDGLSGHAEKTHDGRVHAGSVGGAVLHSIDQGFQREPCITIIRSFIMKSWCPSCALAAASSTLRVGAEVAGRAAMNLSRSCTLPKFERGAANALAICTAPIFQQRGSASRRTARARVDWTAEWSMQPLRRFRILGSRAGSKAFARGRKRPGTEPAALVHCVPAALDPTNVGLHVVDVVRNEIIHREHLTGPRAVGQLTYGS